MITLKVVDTAGGWAVVHSGLVLASFASREEAERTALALAAHRPQRTGAEVDLPTASGGFERRLFAPPEAGVSDRAELR